VSRPETADTVETAPQLAGPAELPANDLPHYDGRWVAMRDDAVVAHAADLETLQAMPEVRDTDALFPVGDPPTGFYTVCA
jgi:hypothetical protein